MLNKFRNAFYSAVAGGIDPMPTLNDAEHNKDDKTLPHKFPYSRPHFLQFNFEEEIQVSADKHIRPIIVPRDISKLPWNSGYAEAVNAGKSFRNEDQACFRRATLHHPESRESIPLRVTSFQTSELSNPALCLPYVYFSIFDGHAGAGAAVVAANQLQYIIHEKLVDIIDHLLPPLEGYLQVDSNSKRGLALWFPEKEVSKEALIVGALESAFWEMDNLIAEDRKKFNIKGGCTALVSLFILGKVYVANAGDSRAIIVKNQVATPVSNDFTPETERSRVRRLAALQPHLLGGEFTHLDFIRRPLHKDLGKRVLYRDAFMTGWAYKTVTQEDLKIPVVHGEGKRSRVLATIGVTRGFGDHDLKALNCNIPIKPFLLSQPEVQVIDIESDVYSYSDVLVMGTDGLWDVTSNDKAAEILQTSLEHFPACDGPRMKYRFTSAAQDLVMQSRGKIHERSWRTAEGKPASTDDVSVFVIPLAPYKEEHALWKRDYDGIHAMYDIDRDTSEGFGKLSLKLSPVPTQKVSPGVCHYSASQCQNKSDLSSVPVSPNLVVVNGCEEKPAMTRVLSKRIYKPLSAFVSKEEGLSKPRSATAQHGAHTDTSAISVGDRMADIEHQDENASLTTIAQFPVVNNTTSKGATSKAIPKARSTQQKKDSTTSVSFINTVQPICDNQGSMGSTAQHVLDENSDEAPSHVELESQPSSPSPDHDTEELKQPPSSTSTIVPLVTWSPKPSENPLSGIN